MLSRLAGGPEKSPDSPERDPALEQAAEFWDRESVECSGVYWGSFVPVSYYINQWVTGVHWLYPLVALKVGWTYQPLDRALVIGCGTGNLERNMRLLRIAERIDAVDISPLSIKTAKELARSQKIDKVRYRLGDCMTMPLTPECYDGVFFHGSLHHMSDPDALLERVYDTLRPGGLVWFDEYIGPSRDEWTEEHLVEARRVFDELPEHLRDRPLAAPFDYRDPTEMIRSSRIMGAMRDRFEIIHYRPDWGNLLMPILTHVKPELLQREDHYFLLHNMIAEERRLIEEGHYEEPLFAVVIARKS